MIPGDQARVTVLVRADPATAFRAFTEEIDRWWLRGVRFRASGRRHGVLHLEPFVGGRLFERVERETGEEPTREDDGRIVATGTVLIWEPPHRLRFEWRGVNFAPGERTEVEVVFEPSPSGTRVTLTHRGFASLRDDHPVRHGEAPAAFVARLGRWWGELASSFRERAEAGHDA